ncbi:MAG: hypothetical protein JNK63_00025 [Chthonomonas sp.]|nr:hypothetical protein [Chthonomonas sp.]
MNSRTPFTLALLTFGFANSNGAVLLNNFNTSNSDTACISFLTPQIRVLRFTTPNYSTQLLRLTTRMTCVDLVNPGVAEIRLNPGTTNAGTLVHTMTPPTFIFGGVRTCVFTTSGFTFQPNTTYGLTVRGTVATDSGAWYYANPIVTPSGLATWIDTRRTYNGTSWGTDALIPRITLEVADPTQTLTGNLTLSDTVGAFAANRTMAYTIVQGTTTVQTGTVIASATTTPYTITLPANITGGAVISFDGSSFLRESHGITLTGTTTNGGFSNLLNGDPDLSGEVDAADIDLVIADFGSTSVGHSDVDVSGEVDAADIDIVISNFGTTDE